MPGYVARHFFVPGTDLLGHERARPYREAACDGDEYEDDWKGHRDCGKLLRPEYPDEEGVYEVEPCLHRHAEDHRQAEEKERLEYGPFRKVLAPEILFIPFAFSAATHFSNTAVGLFL